MFLFVFVFVCLFVCFLPPDYWPELSDKLFCEKKI